MNPDVEEQIYEVINFAGEVIVSYFMKDNYELQKKQIDAHYNKLKKIEEKEQGRVGQTNPPPYQSIGSERPMLSISEQKVEGTACIACSRDHLSTASAMLKEAIRFARRPEKGMRCFEVRDRIATALEELNAMERLDLVPQKIEQLSDKEKELAVWIANQSSELRHIITNIQTIDDLEHASATASKINNEVMAKVWDSQTVGGTINVLCRDIEDEAEQKRCRDNLNAALDERVSR